MNECDFCGRDHNLNEIIGREEDGTPIIMSGPECHCIYEDNVRIAIGICCGQMLGVELLNAEDKSDRKRKQKVK